MKQNVFLKKIHNFILKLEGKKCFQIYTKSNYQKNQFNNCNIFTLVSGYKTFFKSKKYLPIYNFQGISKYIHFVHFQLKN